MTFKARKAFWNVALGDNSKLANLAKLAIDEAEKNLPQRKPWVGLTDEEIRLIMDGRGEEGDDNYVEPVFDPFGVDDHSLFAFARAIEAKHGIKGDA